jgi:hypothetical protein
MFPIHLTHPTYSILALIILIKKLLPNTQC